jgi:alcohol dehydrogenase
VIKNRGNPLKAISFDAEKSISVIECDPPSSPGEGEVQVAIHRVGICGTDTSAWLGKFPFFQFPRIPGHELGGEIVELGSGVTNVAVGDRVSIEPYIYNPESYSSRKGKPNCCNDMSVIGIHSNGGMCERINMPAHKMHVNNSLAYEQLALVETLAIGCHAINRANPKPDDTVLIIGAGPIGLTCVEFVRARGCKIVMMDINEDRLKFCRDKMGIEQTVAVKPDGSHAEEIESLSSGDFFDVVFDATGHPGSMASAVNFVAFGGTLCFVGVSSGEIVIHHPTMHRREMTLMSSRNAMPADFGEVMRLMESGQIVTDPWITHRSTMESLSDDFPSFLDPAAQVLKAMVHITE